MDEWIKKMGYIRTQWNSTPVTEQDPMGPSQDGPLPDTLCFSPSLKDLDNSIRCAFPELSCRY